VVLPSGSVRALDRVFLHAGRVSLGDRTDTQWRMEAAVPLDFLSLWESLGGNGPAALPPEPGSGNKQSP
jgi:hypothetical protein